MASDYARALGARLRGIRTQQGLSLHGVEEKSEGRWKAVVVGSYERGDRAVTVQRLAELADFYGVPVQALLPDAAPTGSSEPPPKLVLDLERLQSVPAEKAGPLARYAATIQGQRGDYNGKVLSIRTDDLRTLAVIYDVAAGDAGRAADQLGRADADARRWPRPVGRALKGLLQARGPALAVPRRARSARAQLASQQAGRAAPLTNPGESSVDSDLASSTASSIATAAGISSLYSSSQVADPQHGPVDRGHAVQRPALRVGGEQLVDPLRVLADALDQVDGVLRHRRGRARPAASASSCTGSRPRWSASNRTSSARLRALLRAGTEVPGGPGSVHPAEVVARPGVDLDLLAGARGTAAPGSRTRSRPSPAWCRRWSGRPAGPARCT